MKEYWSTKWLFFLQRDQCRIKSLLYFSYDQHFAVSKPNKQVTGVINHSTMYYQRHKCKVSLGEENLLFQTRREKWAGKHFPKGKEKKSHLHQHHFQKHNYFLAELISNDQMYEHTGPTICRRYLLYRKKKLKKNVRQIDREWHLCYPLLSVTVQKATTKGNNHKPQIYMFSFNLDQS